MAGLCHLYAKWPLDLYRLVLGHEALHDSPCDEVGHTSEAEHDEVSGFAECEYAAAEVGNLVPLACGYDVLGEEVAAHAGYVVVQDDLNTPILKIRFST